MTDGSGAAAMVAAQRPRSILASRRAATPIVVLWTPVLTISAVADSVVGAPRDNMTEFMGLAEKVSKFNQEALKHLERQTLNPFSGRFSRSPSPRPKFNKDEYGKPAAGSLTEKRGQRAFTQINREILELCEVIHDMGARKRDSDGDECIIIPFGELFAFYTKISDKVVGLLIAAKKRGFVWFEPEILFQRRDDDVLIALMKPIGEIRNIISRQVSASPSPAQAVSSEPEKTSLTPSPLARQESTPSESSSTLTESEKQNLSTASAVSAEEQRTYSSSNAENTTQQTSSTIATDETDLTSSSLVSSVPIKEEHNSSCNAPVVESEQTIPAEPLAEVEQTSSIAVAAPPVEFMDNSRSVEPSPPSEGEQNSTITVSEPSVEVEGRSPSDEPSLPSEGEKNSSTKVAKPPVEVEGSSSFDEPSPPSEGECTPPSTVAIEPDQICHPPEPTVTTEEENTISEPLAASENQDCLTLKIMVECDQAQTVSTAAESDITSSSEAEQTPLAPEVPASAVEETISSTAEVAPDDNEQTTFSSPATTIEPEQHLPPGSECGKVIPSNEKEPTAPSNETGDNTPA